MALILFDTNIFIDMLKGHAEATNELAQYDRPGISTITYMELMSGVPGNPDDGPQLEAVLELFEVLPLDHRVTELAIQIRGASLVTPPKVKLPDAIIGATAAAYEIPIVTRNPKDFGWPGITIHVPYEMDQKTGKIIKVNPPFTGFKPRTSPTLKRIR